MVGRFLLLCLTMVMTGSAYAQEKKIYFTSSGEIIFSGPNITLNDGTEPGSAVRFSPVFNSQNWVNFDYTSQFGWFTGISIRNVGFIYDVPRVEGMPDTRMKHRTYNLGIPVGVKLGNLEERFFYFGYELELPFHYKEKRFESGDRVAREAIWFSNRVSSVQHSIMAGFQFTDGATLKLKYYLTNFFNKDFEQVVNGETTRPYDIGDFNVFYISISFGLLKDKKFYYDNLD